MKPETGIFSPTDNEDDFFNGFRRVQVISQPLSLFQTNGISARHFEAFRSFCQLFELCSEGDLPYLAEMKEMQDRIWDYSLQSYKTPQFSSFYRMKKWQKQRADELSLLTRDVDQLFKTICDDEDSVKLARYISDSESNGYEVIIYKISKN